MRLPILFIFVSFTGISTVFAQQTDVVAREPEGIFVKNDVLEEIQEMLDGKKTDSADDQRNFYAPGTSESGATTEVKNLIMVLNEAVKDGNADTVGKLFRSTEVDKKNMGKFMEVLKGFDIHLLYAKYMPNGDIEATLYLYINQKKAKIPAMWTLTKSKKAPTGWKIGKVKYGSVASSQRKFVSLPELLGHIGDCIFMPISCTIDAVVDVVNTVLTDQSVPSNSE